MECTNENLKAKQKRTTTKNSNSHHQIITENTSQKKAQNHEVVKVELNEINYSFKFQLDDFSCWKD